MRIYSFAREGLELKPIEVEVSLLPGLPHFEVTGLADPAIKESLGRVKSALRNSDYALPVRQRVVFNLRPAYHRKRSEGLDLAFAVSYLVASGQLKMDDVKSDRLYVYGELGLDGRISTSSELELLNDIPDGEILVGEGAKNLARPHYQSKSLREIAELVVSDGQREAPLVRPEIPNLYFSQPAARAMEIIAAGGHSCLVAGPAGSGKSTWVSHLHKILKDLDMDEELEIRRIAKVMGLEPTWRPFVSPHHSTPALSLIGGGVPAFPGEITRAHKGMLFLDEFLEFPVSVRENLREPIETGEITVSRRGTIQKFPADFLLIAATNLCPCGDWTPEKKSGCQYSIRRCFSILEKLSGPLLDRFEILLLSNKWNGPDRISLAEINERVMKARQFAASERGQKVENAKLKMDDIKIDPLSREFFELSTQSRRRELALFRIARTIGDLDGSREILDKHLTEANGLAWQNFAALKTAMQ